MPPLNKDHISRSYKVPMNDTIFAVSPLCMIVVPCYNEAQRLPVDSFRAFVSGTTGIRFLFVNDGSTDGTLPILNLLRAEFPKAVHVLDRPRNQGKAEAVRCGMLRAISEHQAMYTGFCDADLATPLSELLRLLAVLIHAPTVEVVLGSRVRLLGRSVTRQTTRHYFGRIFATLASLTLNLPVYDTQCGAKLFRVTPTLSQILASPFHSRWTFDVELLARFLEIHCADRSWAIRAIYEEPLQRWEDVAGSKLRLQDSFKALADLLLIRRVYFKQ